ncbi:right-handed parallel beta-helix repeat-containing protein, partial [Streptomyces violascens]
MGIKRRHWAWTAAPLALALLAATGCTSTSDTPAEPSGTPSASGAPSTSAARVCAKPAAGPANAPAGAVTVDPAVVGDLAAKTKSSPPNTTFWLRPGKHTLEPDRYAQIIPKDGDSYLGAPGAVLDGRKTNQYAFGGAARNVTIRYLTVQGFVAPQDEGVVNHESADGWVIEHATIQNNSGAGLMAGTRQQVRASCLRGNGQYGMNAYKAGAPLTGLVVEGNEIAANNTDDWERRKPGCGCTGGVKFWAVNGADVRGNWVHDNHGTGLWADTDNNDFLIENNVLEANDGAALIYETSYNAVVRNNTVLRNN